MLLFPAAEFFYESPDVAAFNLIAQGDLIPVEEESFNHTARVCKVGPDGKMYISLGQPFNVAPPEKLDLYDEVGIGGIIRLNLDGSGREVYTYGVRNSVGHDFHPETGELWWTDNQVDGMAMTSHRVKSTARPQQVSTSVPLGMVVAVSEFRTMAMTPRKCLRTSSSRLLKP